MLQKPMTKSQRKLEFMSLLWSILMSTYVTYVYTVNFL